MKRIDWTPAVAVELDEDVELVHALMLAGIAAPTTKARAATWGRRLSMLRGLQPAEPAGLEADDADREGLASRSMSCLRRGERLLETGRFTAGAGPTALPGIFPAKARVDGRPSASWGQARRWGRRPPIAA